MKKPTKLERFIDWIVSLFERYNCKKERHRWGYSLSESGYIHEKDENVPLELWKCVECGCRKEWWIKNRLTPNNNKDE